MSKETRCGESGRVGVAATFTTAWAAAETKVDIMIIMCIYDTLWYQIQSHTITYGIWKLLHSWLSRAEPIPTLISLVGRTCGKSRPLICGIDYIIYSEYTWMVSDVNPWLVVLLKQTSIEIDGFSPALIQWYPLDHSHHSRHQDARALQCADESLKSNRTFLLKARRSLAASLLIGKPKFATKGLFHVEKLTLCRLSWTRHRPM